MTLEFRKAEEQDVPFLLALRQQTMVEHLESAGLYLTNSEHEYRVRDGMEHSWIVSLSGRPVGLLKYRDIADTVEIMQVQVLPGFQGRGLGRKLVLDVMSAAAAQGKALRLTVLKDNPARRLYERLGFTVIGEDDYEFHMEISPRAKITPAERTVHRR